MVNLFRSEGVMYGGREILTRPVWILYNITSDEILRRFSRVGRLNLFNIAVTLVVVT